MKKILIIIAGLIVFSGSFISPAFAEEENNIIDIEKLDFEKLQEIEHIHRKELRDIWDNYPAENKLVPNREDPGFTGIGNRGDILIALDSITDHVAIVKDMYTVIEAHPDNPGSVVAYRDNNWKTRYKKIKGLYVKGATTTQKTNAVKYAEAQLGDPYSLATTRWTEDKWYCSKLVWRAWYNQGFDIEGRSYEPRGTHVTPGDILDSPLTVVFYSSY